MYTEYDPAKANEILDGILPNKDEEGFRLMDNGDRLHIIMDTTPGEGRDTDTMELIAANWEDVGIKTKVNEITRTLLTDRREAGEHMIYIWGSGIGDPALSPRTTGWPRRSRRRTSGTTPTARRAWSRSR